jgi:hypothetical protein
MNVPVCNLGDVSDSIIAAAEAEAGLVYMSRDLWARQSGNP